MVEELHPYIFVFSHQLHQDQSTLGSQIHLFSFSFTGKATIQAGRVDARRIGYCLISHPAQSIS